MKDKKVFDGIFEQTLFEVDYAINTGDIKIYPKILFKEQRDR